MIPAGGVAVGENHWLKPTQPPRLDLTYATLLKRLACWPQSRALLSEMMLPQIAANSSFRVDWGFNEATYILLLCLNKLLNEYHIHTCTLPCFHLNHDDREVLICWII